MRQLALKHFDVLKKVALLDGMMNDLKNGIPQKVRQDYPQLTETEYGDLEAFVTEQLT